MPNTKLIEILKSFSPDEWSEFEKFSQSPFHNTAKIYSGYIRHIRKYSPDFSKEGIDELIFRSLYPEKKFSMQTSKNISGGVFKLAEDFLVQRRIKNNDFQKKYFLLDEYLRRKLDKNFKKGLDQARKLMETELVSEDYFHRLYLLEELEKGHNVSMDRSEENYRNMVKIGEYRVMDFLARATFLMNEMNISSHSYNIKFTGNLAEKILHDAEFNDLSKYIKEAGIKQTEIFEMYMMSLSLYKQIDEHYYNLKRLFLKNIDLFTMGLKYDFFMILIGYCNGRNDQSNKWVRETFDVFDHMLKKGIYASTEKGTMTLIMFRSIFINAIRLKEVKWAEEFTNNYLNKLEPSQRVNTYNFCISRIYFENKNFGKALELISKIDYEVFPFKYDAKTLMLKIFYELNHFEEAFSLIDSFRHFLENNKAVSKFFRDWNVTFINYVKDLIKNRMASNRDGLEELHRNIMLSAPFCSRQWVLEQTEKQLKA